MDLRADDSVAQTDWRARPSPARLAWAAAAIGPGARVRGVAPIVGGMAMAVDGLTIGDRSGRIQRFILRRWTRPGWEVDDPDFTPAREAAVLGRLEAIGFERLAGVAVPRVVAADVDGVIDGAPALLLSHLPGRPRRRAAPLPARAVARLAEVLVAINDLDGGLQDLVAEYYPFADARAVVPPAASAHASLWERAIEIAAGREPSGPVGFMHRDFHPGNTLWHGPHLTGVVDWTQASWGPAAADLGHLRVNLAADHSVELAQAARDAYIAAGGRLADATWWDIRTLLDWLPDLDPAYASGPGLARLERYLESLLHSA
jgi:aminoglycoside phosphotransferase (APT) family kinase protein